MLATLAFLWLVRDRDLRVTPDEERGGLNVAEHGARTELIDLLDAMEAQRRSGDLTRRVPEEEFTEVGQIAKAYNRVIEALRAATDRSLALVREMRDGLITFQPDGTVVSLNPGAEKLLDVAVDAAVGQPLPSLLRTAGLAQPVDPQRLTQRGARLELSLPRPEALRTHLELSIDAVREGDAELLVGLLHDITDRKSVEQQLQRERASVIWRA